MVLWSNGVWKDAKNSKKISAKNIAKKVVSPFQLAYAA